MEIKVHLAITRPLLCRLNELQNFGIARLRVPGVPPGLLAAAIASLPADIAKLKEDLGRAIAWELARYGCIIIDGDTSCETPHSRFLSPLPPLPPDIPNYCPTAGELLKRGDRKMNVSKFPTLVAMLQALQAAGTNIKGVFSIRIVNGSWMPLCIEGIGPGPDRLPAISIAHYGEQNGDAMRDPEMIFELDDRGRRTPTLALLLAE